MLVVGVSAIAVAAGVRPGAAAAAAHQDWPPFVLVAGLLLVGLVAAKDGLFAAAGRRLAGFGSDGLLLAGVIVLVTAVTAVLNLDTSVAFVTPVVVHAWARRRRPGEVAVAACLLLSNAASLFLPGANLTNLIVLGVGRVSGASFAARAVPAAVVSVGVTALAVAVAHRTGRRDRSQTPTVPAPTTDQSTRRRPVVGILAVVAVTAAVLGLSNAALPVLAVGLLAVGLRVRQGAVTLQQAWRAVGPPVLLGLFGLAVTLGTVGRVWSGPASLLHHASPLGSAALGAAAAVAVNNLPAASLLGAGAVAHPVALLVGLNVGPNLFVTGSLSWLLWLRSTRQVGAAPPLRRAVALGLASAPVAIVAAVGALAVVH